MCNRMHKVTVTKVPHQKGNDIQDPKENQVPHGLILTLSSQRTRVSDHCVCKYGRTM